MYYDLTFQVLGLTEALEDELYDHYEAQAFVHGDTQLVALAQCGDSCVIAAQGAVANLRALGLKVLRLYEDLVTRSDIAQRVGVSPQNVGQWVRGERAAGSFPAPFNAVAGGVWLWSDVIAWLEENGKFADGGYHPSRLDHTEVNAWLVGNARPVSAFASWEIRLSAAAHYQPGPTAGSVVLPRLVLGR